MSNQGAIGGRSRRRIQGLTREPRRVEGFDTRLLPTDGLRLEALTTNDDGHYSAWYRGSPPIQFGKQAPAAPILEEPPGNRIVMALTVHAIRRIEAGESQIGIGGVEMIVLDSLMRLLWPNNYAEICDAPQVQTILSRIGSHIGLRIEDQEYLDVNVRDLATRIVQSILDALNQPDWRWRLYHGRMT